MRLVCKHGLIFSAICSQIWPIGELHMNMVIGWNKYRVGVCLEKKIALSKLLHECRHNNSYHYIHNKEIMS